MFSQKVAEQVLQLKEYKQSQHVAFYLAFEAEVLTDVLIEDALACNKQVYLPVIDDFEQRIMKFVRYDKNTSLQKNRFGILEPADLSNCISPVSLNFIGVPLVGFTQDCYRLGLGAGFYDAMFANKADVVLCGLAFECQKVVELKIDPWDVKLDFVATELKLYK